MHAVEVGERHEASCLALNNEVSHRLRGSAVRCERCAGRAVGDEIECPEDTKATHLAINRVLFLQGAQARRLPVLLVAMAAPGNYGPEYKRDFDAIYPDLAAQYGTLLAPGFFAPLLQEGADPAGLALYLQPDGLHPNKDGVTKIAAGLGPQVLELLERVAQR